MFQIRMTALVLCALASPVNAQLGPDPKAVSVQLASGGDRWRFAHADAAMLGHVNLRALRQSPFWAEVQWNEFKDAQLGLLESIDEIWISAPPAPAKSGAAAPKAPESLVLVAGRFSDPEWQKLLKNQPGITTAKALIIGDAAPVNLAKRRMLIPSAPTALRKRAAALEGENDLFFVVDGSAVPGEPTGPAAMFSGMKGAEIAMNFHDDFQTEMKFLLAKESANALLGLFEMMRGQIGKQAGGQEQLAEMAKNIQVNQTDDGVTFKFRATAAQIHQAVAARKDTRPTVPIDESTKIQVTGPAVPPQPAKGKIVIHGLDEGPVEIPMTGKKKP